MAEIPEQPKFQAEVKHSLTKVLYCKPAPSLRLDLIRCFPGNSVKCFKQSCFRTLGK